MEVRPGDNLPYTLIQCNANNMNILDDESFDAVACNAVLEHDKFFWKTLAEVRRVLRPGGLLYVGVPGFSKQNNLIQRIMLKVMHSRFLRSLPLLYPFARWTMLTRLAFTSTLMFHGAPHDFYRFSEEAIKEVFLEGLVVLHLECMLKPVRIIGIGRKPDGNK
jgi:ubiquinone/menaquinone biosynthesis C-methylase UbiE